MIREVRPDPFIFRNAVSGAGYEWFKGRDGQPRLVMQDAPGVGLQVKKLHPGLFREFARLEPTQEAIRGFAKEYGDLFNRWQDSRREDGTLMWGTLLRTWKEEIGEMRVLVGLWDQIQARQIAELKKIVTQTKEGPWYRIVTPKHDASASVAYENTPSPLNEPISYSRIQFAPDDVLLPARCALQLEINKRLSEDSTIPLLTWTPDTKETSGGYHQRLIFRPSSLLAAMWIQFAQAVTEEFQLRQCDFCGDYFQVGPGARRLDATTCSDVCRVRRWAGRKNPAKRKARKSLR
jgi:hypothetical protein